MSGGHRKAVNWAAIAVGVTVVVTLVAWASSSLGAAYTVGKITAQKDAKVEKLEAEVTELKEADQRILKEVRDYLKDSRGKLDQILEKTSRVQGAFEQHTRYEHRDPLDR